MIPILRCCAPRSRPSLEARMERMVAKLRAERPELSPDADLRALQAPTLGPGPTLHLDDQSGINVSVAYDWSYLQDRARMRAEAGDLVAASHPPPAGYERYCQERLGAGQVAWLVPKQRRYRVNLASHCWTDRAVRHELVRLLRADQLRYIHPLMGTRDVWQLARMLGRASRRPIAVIAPLPGVTSWVNDKLEFAAVIRRLFGDRWLPQTRACASLVMASQMVRALADSHRMIGVKLPDAAGGGGNFVIPAERIRGRSLAEVTAEVRALLKGVGWRGEKSLLVGAWESDVLSAPSAQLWIPLPPAQPIVEGIFEQILEGSEGEFVGCRTTDLPRGIVEEIVDRCSLVGRLFQGLGYLGRCSFDLVVVGSRLDRSRLEFIECNGRWGGASLPMTLVNRLLPSEAPRHYLVRSLPLPRACSLRFTDVVHGLGGRVFDVRTEHGHVVLFNPSNLTLRAAVSVIAFGRTIEHARQLIDGDVHPRLRALCGSREAGS